MADTSSSVLLCSFDGVDPYPTLSLALLTDGRHRGIDTVVWLLPTALAACLLCSLLVVNARQRTTLIDYNVPLQLQALQGGFMHIFRLRCLRFLQLVSACVLRGNKTGVGELQKPDGGVPVVEIGGRLFVVRETKTPTVENPEQ